MRGTKMRVLLFIMFATLSLLVIPRVSAGLGSKWWTPDYVDFDVYLSSYDVLARTDSMYWLTNQYASHEESSGKSLSYVHEHRTDHYLLEGDGYYITNLPPPITYSNSAWWEEESDGYEEVEVIAQEPELIQIETNYYVKVRFDILLEGDNYMAFEGELGEDRWYYQDFPIDYYVYGTKKFYQPWPPPPSCPFVYVWDGTHYVIDNNLLAASESSNGADVEDYYKLEQTLIPKHEGTSFSSYSLLISEFENEHSYLDQVKLLAIDHDSDVNVAVSSTGEILTYRVPSPPVSCVNRNGEDVLDAIEAMDEQIYEGYAGDYLLLDFGDLNVNDDAKLVMRADDWEKWSILVQVLNESGSWETVDTVIPRVHWATEIVDLCGYLPAVNGELKVRLYLTANHKIDFIGLDTSEQADIKKRKARLISAIHSEEGLVTWKLRFDDEVYVELVPGQRIGLTFRFFTHPKDSRTFIIYVNGHYNTITT